MQSSACAATAEHACVGCADSSAGVVTLSLARMAGERHNNRQRLRAQVLDSAAAAELLATLQLASGAAREAEPDAALREELAAWADEATEPGAAAARVEAGFARLVDAAAAAQQAGSAMAGVAHMDGEEPPPQTISAVAQAVRGDVLSLVHAAADSAQQWVPLVRISDNDLQTQLASPLPLGMLCVAQQAAFRPTLHWSIADDVAAPFTGRCCVLRDARVSAHFATVQDAVLRAAQSLLAAELPALAQLEHFAVASCGGAGREPAPRVAASSVGVWGHNAYRELVAEVREARMLLQVSAHRFDAHASAHCVAAS